MVKYTLPDWLSYLKHSDFNFREIVQENPVNNTETRANSELEHIAECSPRGPLQFGMKK